MSSISGSVTLKTISAPFEGGKILRESDIFQTRCLGIIFYLGELLSKVLLFGFCIPIGEWLKEKSIEIRRSEDEIAMKLYIDRIDTSQSTEIEEVFDEDTKEFRRVEVISKTQEKTDLILGDLTREIDRKVEVICQRYQEGDVLAEDLKNAVIDIVITLQNPPHHLEDEEIVEQTEPVFYLFISKLAEKINVETELQSSKSENAELFLLSIQERKIILS